ncbi:MAG TPA: potassium/proton antiporter [Trebonia sp.]|nr:potassium/proton antiporter [Trebonia sp.]
MTGTDAFGLVVLVIGLVGTAAVLSNRLSARLRVPAPAFFLVGAAAVAELLPAGSVLPVGDVQKIVSVALAIILFDGGMHIGWRKFRSAVTAIVWVGVVGTLVTAAGATVCAHFVAGLDWRLSMLLGTAVSATDPAVVFSVFGRREIAGRTGVLLEGESGANDPVGIALLASLLTAQGGAGGIALHVAAEFAEQMVIGTVIGAIGGIALLAFMRRVPLPSEGLYSPRVLAGVLCIFGLAEVARGSGFLAVFVAGILIGDGPAPYKREIQRFHSSLASLAEITAFVMLGLTIRLTTLSNASAWQDGLAIAALLAFVIRPVLVGLVSLPIRMTARERVFFLWTGLKGAVPVLLGTMIAASGTPGTSDVYEIIFVIVGFSVVIQGGFVPALAHRLRIPLRTVEPEPWSLGVRLREEPEGLHRYRVVAGAPADGSSIRDLPCGEDVWVSVVIREGTLVAEGGDTTLRAGDEVLVLVDPGDEELLDRLFTLPAAEQEGAGGGI